MSRAFHRSVVGVCVVLAAAVVGCGGAAPAKVDAATDAGGSGDAQADVPLGADAAPTGVVAAVTGNIPPKVHLWSLDGAAVLTARAGVMAPESAQHLARSADGRFLYVLGRKVAAFSVDATGGLGVINEVDTALTRWSGLAVEPSKRWLVVADSSSGVSVFALQPDGGIGRALGVVAVGPGAQDVTFDPSGKFVFASSCAGDLVARYLLDPDTGSLLPQQPTLLAEPSRLVFHPSGKTAYVVNAKEITSFNYDAETGTLAEPEAVPYLPADDLPIGQGFCTFSRMVVHPARTFAYVSSWDGNAIAILSVAPSGRLSVVGLEKFYAFRAARALAVDPTGTFLLVGNSAGGLQIFRISPEDGRLTFVGGGVQGVNAQATDALEFLP